MAKKQHASAGHKLGQLVGDWFEEYIVYPLLRQVGNRLKLYLDTRFRTRAARGDKILWKDEEGNRVDFDFVLELDGSDEALGIPVAFFESFWRRGARHSKDKARDDIGKLLPMRQAYPTARFLGIIAGGDFTAPARELVQNRHIDLFYVPKAKILTAFERCKLLIDYPDRSPESEKAKLANALERSLTPELRRRIAEEMRGLVGETSLNGYVERVYAALAALPQEIRFIAQRRSKPKVFPTIAAASAFLNNPQFEFAQVEEDFVYEITYSDGTEFERPVRTVQELKALHGQTERLSQHMASLRK
jgi:hypothetical protein